MHEGLIGGLVNRAISDALRDGAEACEARGILVVPDLEATGSDVDDPPLYQAVYTIFRGLPERLASGATLYVRTADDVEGTMLTWDATEGKGEGDAPDASVKDVMRRGPYGDLLELAIVGLEAICRARSEQWGAQATPHESGLTGLDLTPRLRRRVVFLIPPDRVRGAEK